MKKIFLVLLIGLCWVIYAQTSTTVSDIQQGNVAENTQVQVTGIVIANANFKNMFIWDDSNSNGAIDVYECINIYCGTSHAMDSYNVGDKVQITGEYKENYGESEIQVSDASNDISVLSTGNSIPEPLAVDSSIINDSEGADDATAEPYEGCLVKISNATCSAEPSSSNYYEATVSTDGTNNTIIDDSVWYQYGGTNPFVSGHTYNIVGIVRFTYSKYKINPRDDSDVVEVSAVEDWSLYGK